MPSEGGAASTPSCATKKGSSPCQPSILTFFSKGSGVHGKSSSSISNRGNNNDSKTSDKHKKISVKGAGTPKRQGSVGHQAPPTPDPEAGDGDHQSAAIALDNTLPGKRSRRSEGQGVGEAGGDEIRSSPSAKFGRTCAGLGAGGTVNLTAIVADISLIGTGGSPETDRDDQSPTATTTMAAAAAAVKTAVDRFSGVASEETGELRRMRGDGDADMGETDEEIDERKDHDEVEQKREKGELQQKSETGDMEEEEGNAADSVKDKDESEEETIVQQNSGISEYELQRLERIKKNQAFMASLGLDTAKPVGVSAGGGNVSGRSGSNKGGSKKRSRPVSKAKERAVSLPVRRSSRGRGSPPVDYGQDQAPAQVLSHGVNMGGDTCTLHQQQQQQQYQQQEQPVLQIDYDDSTVLKYLCGDAEEKREDRNNSSSNHSNSSGADFDKSAIDSPGKCPASASGTASGSTGARASQGERKVVVGLKVIDLDNPLSAAGLSTIYSMHFCDAAGGLNAPSLLAAGGKGGVVALFSTRRHEQSAKETKKMEDDEDDGEDDERTLMTFKAHKGWVSAVRFLNDGQSGGGGANRDNGMRVGRLLSSANDSVVSLWDTSKQHRGVPRQLCAADDFHPTRKGIFAMDSIGTRVATGSKDTTVAISSLSPTGLSLDRVLGDSGGSQAFHEKVIKGVSLRDDNTVASCGDDSNVRVCDLRSPSFFGVSQRLDGVHDGPCHTVRWHPLDGNLLLTAGLDSTMKMFDLRRLDAPVHVLQGHCPYMLARPRAIHRPEFLPAGRVGGQRAGLNIITCGERSDKLSMYDAASGATVSRGVLGHEATALAVGGAGDSESPSAPGHGLTIAAAASGGSVILLEPIWG